MLRRGRKSIRKQTSLDRQLMGKTLRYEALEGEEAETQKV